MIKRIFFTLNLIFAAVLLTSCENEEAVNQPLTCDLNVKDCLYYFKDKEVLVSLNPKPLKALDVTHLKVENLGDYENLGLKIYALNMSMGEIKPKLMKLENGIYEGKIVLSSCALDRMRFRAELTQGEKPIGFHFDFELRR